MKYSVLTIFLITGYVALLLAGFQQLNSWWRHVGTAAWLALVVYLLVLAFDPLRRSRALFGRVTLACLAMYLAVSLLPNLPADYLPHQWIAAYWTPDASVYTAMPTIYTAPTAAPYAGNPFGAGGGMTASYMMQSSTVTTWAPGQLTVTSAAVVDPGGIIRMMAAMNTALAIGLLGGVLAVWKHRRAERSEAKLPLVAGETADAQAA